MTTEICGRSIRAGDNTQGRTSQQRLACLAAACDRGRMMKATTKEFREFLLKQNAFALAVGVVIGAAIGKVVSGIVEDVVMPIVGLVLPGGEWRNAQIVLSGQNAIKYGDLADRKSVVVALVVFLLIK